MLVAVGAILLLAVVGWGVLTGSVRVVCGRFQFGSDCHRPSDGIVTKLTIQLKQAFTNCVHDYNRATNGVTHTRKFVHAIDSSV